MGTRALQYDVVIVGAGWAGIGVSRTLKDAGYRHVVYERNRICETWRTQRWSSFRMNTPNVLTVMPGEQYGGDEPEGYMTCGEFIDMVEGYAKHHNLPVLENVPVTEVRQIGPDFEIVTGTGTAVAHNVVIATGNLNVPRRPKLNTELPKSIHQIDGSEYWDANALAPGAVLVIGCGNSGGQIAEDLARSGRSVFLSSGKNGRIPRRYRGRDIYVWLVENGRMSKPRTASTGRPLIGATHTISLQSLSAQGVVLLGRFEHVLPDGTMTFADSLSDSVAFGDQVSEEIRHDVDSYIELIGIDAPEAVPDIAESVSGRFPDPPIRQLDLVGAGITTVVWSTGYTGDFSWLRVPGVIDQGGSPLQEKCVSVPGIYFAGLDTSESLAAGTVLAVEEECRRIVDHIREHRDKRHNPA